MQAIRATVLAAALSPLLAAQAQQLSVGGTYPTRATLIAGRNSCGAVEVQDNVTTVGHAAGQHTLSLTHAGTTYDGSIDDDGAFATSPKILNAGSTQYTIAIEGSFQTTGFTATVTLQVRQQTAPTTCSYAVSWAGTKQGPANVIPGIPRDGRSLFVRHFGAADFSFPIGITLSRDGDLFVADGDFAIHRIAPSGALSVIAGAPGIAGFRDGSSSEARFAGLHGIVVDGHGNLFVTDNPNHAVRRIAPDGTVTTVAGDGTPGSADGTGRAARLNSPHDLTIDAEENLYVADVANHTIRKITPSGVVTTLAGQAGQRGGIDGRGSQARFEFPSSMAVDAAGNLWVGGNGTIRRIARDATVTTIAGVNGVSGAADGRGTEVRLQGPEGLAFAPDGDLYISSGSTLRKMDPQFRVTTVAGTAGVTGDAEGRGSAVRLTLPLGIAVNAESRIFFADATNRRIFSAIPDNLTCTDSPSRLCLNDHRFSVLLYGAGTAVAQKVNPLLGYFTNDHGPVAFVKAVDERPERTSFSLVYGGLAGGAAVTVLDTFTGRATPLAGDANCGGVHSDSIAVAASGPPSGSASGRRRATRHPQACPTDALCLLDRLRITLRARDPRTGGFADGVALPAGTDRLGFFSVPALSGAGEDAEVWVNVIDRRTEDGTLSVVHGSLTEYEYTLTVTDPQTARAMQFTHSAGTPCGDFASFPF